MIPLTDPFKLFFYLFQKAIKLIIKLLHLLYIDFTKWILKLLAKKLYRIDNLGTIPGYFRIPIYFLGILGSFFFWTFVFLFIPQPNLEEGLFLARSSLFLASIIFYLLDIFLLGCYRSGFRNFLFRVLSPIKEALRRVFLVGVHFVRIIRRRRWDY